MQYNMQLSTIMMHMMMQVGSPETKLTQATQDLGTSMCVQPIPTCSVWVIVVTLQERGLLCDEIGLPGLEQPLPRVYTSHACNIWH